MRFNRFLSLFLFCAVLLILPGTVLAQDTDVFKGWRLLSWSADEKVWLWNLQTGEEILRLQQDSPVKQAQFLEDGRIFVMTRDEVNFWDSATGTLLVSISFPGSQVQDAFMAPDNRVIVTGPSASGFTVHIYARWMASTGLPSSIYSHGPKMVRCGCGTSQPGNPFTPSTIATQ